MTGCDKEQRASWQESWGHIYARCSHEVGGEGVVWEMEGGAGGWVGGVAGWLAERIEGTLGIRDRQAVWDGVVSSALQCQAPMPLCSALAGGSAGGPEPLSSAYIHVTMSSWGAVTNGV